MGINNLSLIGESSFSWAWLIFTLLLQLIIGLLAYFLGPFLKDIYVSKKAERSVKQAHINRFIFTISVGLLTGTGLWVVGYIMLGLGKLIELTWPGYLIIILGLSFLTIAIAILILKTTKTIDNIINFPEYKRNAEKEIKYLREKFQIKENEHEP